MKSIGIQGAKGSFSKITAQQFAKTYKITNFLLNYLISSENLFRALKNKEIDFGIFTIKNVQVGIVIESIEALAKYRCQIVDIFQIPVSQNLITLLRISIKQIMEIHSHRQALRQCRKFLTTNF